MLVCLVLLLFIFGSYAKNPNANIDRLWTQRKAVCEKNDCAGTIPDENQNCVFSCLSRACYDEVYSQEPLEDGEIDSTRYRQFIACVRKEQIAYNVILSSLLYALYVTILLIYIFSGFRERNQDLENSIVVVDVIVGVVLSNCNGRSN